jgi:hypothetical protein
VVREERRGGVREMGKRPATVRLTRAGEVLEVGGEADKRARSAASGRERRGSWAAGHLWAARLKLGCIRACVEPEKRPTA